MDKGDVSVKTLFPANEVGYVKNNPIIACHCIVIKVYQGFPAAVTDIFLHLFYEGRGGEVLACSTTHPST
eukprot:10264425-Ditylum_brightwellii.AAC.1